MKQRDFGDCVHMDRLRVLKVAASLTAIAMSSNAYAGSVIIGGQTLKSYEDIGNYFYGITSTHMSNAITTKTLTKLDLVKLDGRFLFVSPSLETWKDRYVWIGGGLIKASTDTQLMIGYTEQLKTEAIFYYFEKVGLVDRFDIINENAFTKDVEKNYDFVVTMRSDFNGQRDAKSANARKTEFFVRNVKSGSEQKITETMGSPALVSLFEAVAVKFSDAVKAAK